MQEVENIGSFFAELETRRTCKWCKHPYKKVMPRIGLCTGCNRVRKDIDRSIASGNQYSLKILNRKKDILIKVGNFYGEIHLSDITVLRVETELNFLSRHFLKKAIFKEIDFSLKGKLDQEHRKYLFFIISMFSREYFQKNLFTLAGNDPDGDFDSQIFP